MSFMYCLGPCINCGVVFSFNPDLVPSMRTEIQNGKRVYGEGEREPICRNCFEQGNRMRVERGLEPLPLHPDAYEPQEVE